MSLFKRYSAVPIFGVPLDKLETLTAKTSGDSLKWLLGLMCEYQVEPTDLPEGITDITPYYGAGANFRYFLDHPERNTANIYLMPNKDGARAQSVTGAKDDKLVFGDDIRTIHMPSDQDVFAITGFGPRYPGTICLHEMIVYKG